MFFVVRSNDSFNFPLRWIQYIVIVTEHICSSMLTLNYVETMWHDSYSTHTPLCWRWIMLRPCDTTPTVHMLLYADVELSPQYLRLWWELMRLSVCRFYSGTYATPTKHTFRSSDSEQHSITTPPPPTPTPPPPPQPPTPTPPHTRPHVPVIEAQYWAYSL